MRATRHGFLPIFKDAHHSRYKSMYLTMVIKTLHFLHFFYIETLTPQITTLPPRNSNTFVGGKCRMMSFGTNRKPGKSSGVYIAVRYPCDLSHSKVAIMSTACPRKAVPTMFSMHMSRHTAVGTTECTMLKYFIMA